MGCKIWPDIQRYLISSVLKLSSIFLTEISSSYKILGLLTRFHHVQLAGFMPSHWPKKALVTRIGPHFCVVKTSLQGMSRVNIGQWSIACFLHTLIYIFANTQILQSHQGMQIDPALIWK